jgi:hypothetical protein
MRCGLEVSCFERLGEMPAGAAALFGGDFYSSLSWYGVVCLHALPEGARAAFFVVSAGGAVVAVAPMMRLADGRYAALTTPYSALWRVLAAAGVDGEMLRSAGVALGRVWRAGGTVRLDCLDGGDFATGAAVAGARGTGLLPLRFAHFGNWVQPAGVGGWAAYLAGRPGHLREAIRRRGRQAAREGVVFQVVTGGEGLEAGIAAYEAVYARSWKDAEPHPGFIPGLMRACAAEGALRLGVLRRAGEVLAAQVWVARPGWASVLKLAHDEAARALSPGTVLTAMMIERVLRDDAGAELDFGRGDDLYKRDWTSVRRGREGVVLASPFVAAGVGAIARHFGGVVKKRVRI